MDEQTKAQRTLTHSGSTAEVEGVSLELSPLGSLEAASGWGGALFRAGVNPGLEVGPV